MAFGSRRRESRQNGNYDNTNKGILFENDRKRSDKHPDYRGSLNVDGREYWLSGWIKETKKGEALSLSIEPKQEQRRDSYERAQAPDRRDGPPPPDGPEDYYR